MNKTILITALLSICLSGNAQTQSCASYLKARPRADVNVPFKYTDPGVETPIQWGLDLAWLSEDNVRTGVLYCGKDLIDIVRLSFQPTASVEGGSFSSDQKKDLDRRIRIVKAHCKSGISLNINCDHKSVDNWYKDMTVNTNERAGRWAKVIDMSIDYYKKKGLTNWVSISPFNEPDFGWQEHIKSQGKNESVCMNDFKEICRIFKQDEQYSEKYSDVRMCGGNTLNNDRALDYWNHLKEYLDEGNTHQLAGSFDNYASFFEKVRDNGKHATADELHNTMEAMVGVEYGMQTGIWWGTAEYTRSQFMKATNFQNPGKRLAYAEHRPNWTAASVYRHTDGSVQGFVGSSERQAMNTTYNFAALDRPVWYDGVRGREHVIELVGPKTAGYQNGQTNGETLVDIQGGDDIMPALQAGVYKIMNVNSGLVMGFGSTPTSWTSVTQKKNANNAKYLQWKVTPTAKSGDYNYYTLTLNVGNNITLDILNWNLNAGADVGGYPQGGTPGTNEQWYLQYAGNGAFYIRSRFSTKCLEVASGRTTAGANIQMGEFNGEKYQQWRFIATTVTPDLTAPASPAALKAESFQASIRLSWEACQDKDIKSYTILRSDDGSEFYTLANEIAGTEFVDNEADDNTTYTYKVYAEDLSLNRSETSTAVTATTSGAKGAVLSLPLSDDLLDVSENINHPVLSGDSAFITYKEHTAKVFDGTKTFMQLPYTVANHDELSISFWLYYRGGKAWQRVFDFGNGTDQYMFLTPQNGSGVHFAIKNGGEEQQLHPGKILQTTKWHHIVVTLGENGGKMYLNGELLCENPDISIKPSDFKPIFNYIGRSQFTADPYLKAYLHDFSIFNYQLSADEIAELATGISTIAEPAPEANYCATYDISGRKATAHTRGIVIKNGKKTITRK